MLLIERIKAISGEISSDPLSRGYSGMDDQAAADSLNAANRDVDVELVKSAAVLEAIVIAEYNALIDTQKALVNSMLAMGELAPHGPNTKAVFAGIFDSGTTTRTNLLALSTETVSRGVEIGVGAVTLGDVERARAYGG